MNPTLELDFWWRLLGILALEISLVIALAFLAQSLTPSVFWRRSIWQSCFVCVLLLVGSEITGVGRGVAVWFAGKPAMERKIFVRTVSAEQQRIPVPIESETAPISFFEKELPIARAIWWPGILWLAGLGLIFARILFARVLFLSLRWRKGEITNATLLNRVSELALRLGIRRKVYLLESPGFSGPMTFGIVQPCIGLPTSFAQTFSSAQQNAMLTHELAHVSALDPFWYLLADVTGALLWWHPLVWLARRRLHSASELAADEAATILENGPGTLAECLVNLGQRMTQSRSFGWLGVDGNGFRSHLGQRVERLLNLRSQTWRPTQSWPFTLTKLITPFVLVALIIFTTGWIENRNPKKEKTLKSTMQHSLQRSLASLSLLAVLEPTSPKIDQSRSTSARSALPNETKTKTISQKSVQVIARFYQLAPEIPNLVMDEVLRGFQGILNQEQVNVLTNLLRQRAGANFIKTAYLINKEGEGSTFDQRSPTDQSTLGFSITWRPRMEGKDYRLDLSILIGNFSKEGKPLGEMDFDLTNSILIPAGRSVVIASEKPDANGRNYVIILTPSAPTQELFTRSFKLNPEKFMKALEKIPSSVSKPTPNNSFIDEAFLSGNPITVAKTNFQPTINQKIRNYFETAGVDFGEPGTPNGKTVFFNDRRGLLLVRASLQDLEIIQNAIATFGAEPPPPQVVIETKFVEISDAAMKKLGLDWFTRNAISSRTNQTMSDVVLTGTNVTKDKIDAAGNATNLLPTVTAIFTEPQYQVVIKALEKASGIDLISAPKVTTLSGRQTQIGTLDLVPVQSSVVVPGAKGTLPNGGIQTYSLPFGPVLDVVPSVAADGLAIQMTVVAATLTEFLGFEKNTTKSSPPIRLRQFTDSAKIWDGQTLMLGQILQTQMGNKKQLLVFVTATIIDPAGNRVHSEKELLFTTNSVPKQQERKQILGERDWIPKNSK